SCSPSASPSASDPPPIRPPHAAAISWPGSMKRDGDQSNWRTWAIGILIALVLIVALQNSQEVRVEVLFLSVDAPLIVILLVAVAIGALIGYAAPVLLRHRRDERRRREG